MSRIAINNGGSGGLIRSALNAMFTELYTWFRDTNVLYNDLIMPASNLRPGNTPPVWAASIGGIYGYRFDAGVADELHGSAEIQHDYKEGTDLSFHVHWTPTTTNTGDIVWGVEYSIANVGDAFPAPTTVTSVPVAASGVVGKHAITNIVNIPGTGLKIGAVVRYRLFRQAGGTDTFTGNAFLESVGIHYQCDTVGSLSIASK